MCICVCVCVCVCVCECMCVCVCVCKCVCVCVCVCACVCVSVLTHVPMTCNLSPNTSGTPLGCILTSGTPLGCILTSGTPLGCILTSQTLPSSQLSLASLLKSLEVEQMLFLISTHQNKQCAFQTITGCGTNMVSHFHPPHQGKTLQVSYTGEV